MISRFLSKFLLRVFYLEYGYQHSDYEYKQPSYGGYKKESGYGQTEYRKTEYGKKGYDMTRSMA